MIKARKGSGGKGQNMAKAWRWNLGVLRTWSVGHKEMKQQC